MWEISNKLQILGFIYSIVLGMFYCAFYDILRAIRIVKKPKTLTVLFQDIFFFFTISIISFIFFLAITNGEIRAYILIGKIIGFVIFATLFSRFFLRLATFVVNLIFKLFCAVSKGFYRLFDKIDTILSKFFKNTFKCLKKGLKIVKGLLYTNNAV